MSAKYIWLGRITIPSIKKNKHKLLWGKPFKWQWALFYEEKTYLSGTWIKKHMIFDSRADARYFKKYNLSHHLRGLVRNVKMKRRLVQANWEDYQDSFSYNAKGNGNGQ